jgi:hypothetical protein
MTFLEQIRLFRSSEFITGVHGAWIGLGKSFAILALLYLKWVGPIFTNDNTIICRSVL